MSTAEFRIPHADVAALLDRCRMLDVALTVEDGRLVAEGPDTADIDALLAEVQAHKAQVVAHLRTVGPLVHPSLLPISEREQVGLLALAGACDWPAVRLWTGHSIGPGASAWRATVSHLNHLGAVFCKGALQRHMRCAACGAN